MSGKNTSDQNPDAPQADNVDSEENTQTQTQSQQQPPVQQQQANSGQPQVRGGRFEPQPKEDIAIPAAAQPGPLTQAQFLPMPTGGLRALAIQLHPDDRDDQEKMQNHLNDLLTLNRDVLRDPDTHPVGTFVRVK